jgi:hypothetical protein
MLKDFSELKQIEKITRVIVAPGRGGCPQSSKIPAGGMRKNDWLIYLTDEQMLQVKEQLKLRTAISSINVTADAMKSGTVAFR